MKRTASTLLCMLVLSFLAVNGAELVSVVEANPGPVTSRHPSVRAPEIEFNASISAVKGELWATVNAEYYMDTIHMFGDSWEVPNSGMGMIANPSPYVTVTVDYNTVAAHYPIHPNAKNISVKIDGTEVNWTMTEENFRLDYLGMDLPELNWIVTPVPKYFSVTTSYEHPVLANPRNHDNLGKLAFVIPFDYRCEGERWFIPYSDVHINLMTNQFNFSNVQAYCIDVHERTATLEDNISVEDDKDNVEINMKTFDAFNPYFVVVYFDVPQEPLIPLSPSIPFPLTPQEIPTQTPTDPQETSTPTQTTPQETPAQTPTAPEESSQPDAQDPQEKLPTIITATSTISAIAIATGTLIYFKKRKDGKKVKI